VSKKYGTKGYPAELREKAVNLVTERGYTIQQVAEQLGCSQESVRRWKEAKMQKSDPEPAPSTFFPYRLVGVSSMTMRMDVAMAMSSLSCSLMTESMLSKSSWVLHPMIFIW
jgi:transposase-like protein